MFSFGKMSRELVNPIRDLFDAASEAMADKAERMELEDECEQNHSSLARRGALFCQVCGADLRDG